MKHNHLWRLGACGLLLGAGAALANPGDLDSGFGSAGLVTTDLGADNDMAAAVAVDGDGILVAGSGYTGTDYDFALLRYTNTGALDGGFGIGGKAVTAIGPGNDVVTAMARQPDGRIVVAGYIESGTNVYFALARYTAAGTLDASFGSGGIVTTWVGNGRAEARAMAIQPDGRIVVAGSSYRTVIATDLALVRYNSDGSVDNTFGNAGTVITTVGQSSVAYAVALQEDGRILVAGNREADGLNDTLVVRYDASGALDAGFGTGGIVTTPVGYGYDNAYAMALQPDGRILVAGLCEGDTSMALGDPSQTDFCLVRYTSGGALDGTFGSGGMVITEVSGDRDTGFALRLQPDGRILAAGNGYRAGSYQDMVLVRYLADGALDTTFGASGVVFPTHTSGNEEFTALALQADGKVVAAGNSLVSTSDLVLARFLANDADNNGAAEAWDLTPSTVSLADAANVTLESTQTSSLFTVSGLGSGITAALTISDGEYSLNGGAFTDRPAFVTNGSTLVLRHTAAATAATEVFTTLRIGLRDPQSPAALAGAQVLASFTSTTSDAPLFTGGTGAFTIAENSARGTVITTVSAEDPEADTVNYAIADGNTGGAFAIDALSGVVTVNGDIDYETLATYTLSVQATDEHGATSYSTVEINLTDVAEGIGGGGGGGAFGPLGVLLGLGAALRRRARRIDENEPFRLSPPEAGRGVRMRLGSGTLGQRC